MVAWADGPGETSAMRDWQDDYVRSPVEELLSSLHAGTAVQESASFARLAKGIDYLFRTEAPEHGPWSDHQSTTDGATTYLCTRLDADTLEVVAMTDIDFDGRSFPSKTILRRAAGKEISVECYIGQVDPVTGAPPRFADDVIILPAQAGDEINPVSHLIIRRHEEPIVWTRAFETSMKQ